MNIAFAAGYERYRAEFEKVITNFDQVGTAMGNPTRNVIKFVEVAGSLYNIKAFRKANMLNRVVYKFLRKSKAQRSFEYAKLLMEKGIGTPEPIAYLNQYSLFTLAASYYICRQLQDVFTLEKVIYDLDFPDRENIIRHYTKLIFSLHENGIEFKDNSAGNTLIKKENDTYQLYLVDLNRMNFHQHMSMELRMRNFSRLTIDFQVIRLIADEYAQLSGIPADTAFKQISDFTNAFQEKAKRKRKIKQRLKFLKNK